MSNSPANANRTGIGASVKRREDFRFLTGQGTYTDDINRPDQTHAYILRSPHAHARINGIDTAAALRSARRRRDLHRQGHRGRQGRRLALRLADPLQGRQPDGRAAAPAAGARQGAPCRRSGRRRHRRDLRAGQGRGRADHGRLRGAAGGHRPAADALKAGAPLVHEQAPGNLCFDWHLGDKAATDAAFAKAAHVTKLDLINNRLVPNAMEPRAAIGEFDRATGDYTL